MSDVRVRKLQEFIKQEVSQMLMRGLNRFKTCIWPCAYRAWQGIKIAPYSNDYL